MFTIQVPSFWALFGGEYVIFSKIPPSKNHTIMLSYWPPPSLHVKSGSLYQTDGPNVVDTKTCQFHVTNYGTTVLGTPMGSHSYVISKCEETALSPFYCDPLAKLGVPTV